MSQFRVITHFMVQLSTYPPKYRHQGDSDGSSAVWHDDSCLTSCLLIYAISFVSPFRKLRTLSQAGNLAPIVGRLRPIKRGRRGA